MGTSQHLYLATHSVWQIKPQLKIYTEETDPQYCQGNNAMYHSAIKIVCTVLIRIPVCYYLPQSQIINTSYHLSSKHLGQGTPPLPPPLPPPPHQAWCLLCCPQTNWCHPARTNRGPKGSVPPATFSFNITGSAVRCWKLMDMAQCQYSHYINACLGSYAWRDLLPEVCRL